MTTGDMHLTALASLLEEEEFETLGAVVREFSSDGESATLDRQFKTAHSALEGRLGGRGRRSAEAERLRAAYATVALLFVPAASR